MQFKAQKVASCVDEGPLTGYLYLWSFEHTGPLREKRSCASMHTVVSLSEPVGGVANDSGNLAFSLRLSLQQANTSAGC
jgi:hypothetical protein